MARISEFTAADRSALMKQVEAVQQSGTLAQASQSFLDALYSYLDESVVLGRLFATVPFVKLPATEKDFTTRLAKSAGIADQLKDTTPVLSLLGTR